MASRVRGMSRWVSKLEKRAFHKVLTWSLLAERAFQNDSRTVPKRFQNDSKTIPRGVFEPIWNRFRTDFEPIAGGSSKKIPKRFRNDPKTIPKRFQNDSPKGFRTDFEPIANRFRTVFELISNRVLQAGLGRAVSMCPASVFGPILRGQRGNMGRVGGLLVLVRNVWFDPTRASRAKAIHPINQQV